VSAGDYAVLERVGGDFPDELVYSTVAGLYQLWLKSRNLLAGPWEWIVCTHDGHPLDFSSPFAAREEATADLVAYLSGLLGPPSAADLLEVVAAAPLDPRPTAPAPATCNAPASAAGCPGADAEVIGLALDLAISVLRKARQSYPQAVSSGHAAC
jgi:hypothetical protein